LHLSLAVSLEHLIYEVAPEYEVQVVPLIDVLAAKKASQLLYYRKTD
jgi:hypothetical protein